MTDKNNIESFFKNRLEDHEFPFRESDWMLLEERLNAAGMSGNASSGGMSLYVKIILLAAALSLAFLLGWFAHDRLDIFSNSPNDKPEDSKNTIYSKSHLGNVDESTSNAGLYNSKLPVIQENSTIENIILPVEEGVTGKKDNQLNDQNKSALENTTLTSTTGEVTSKEVTILQQQETTYPEYSDIISSDIEISKNEMEDSKEAYYGPASTRVDKPKSDAKVPPNGTVLLPVSPRQGLISTPVLNQMNGDLHLNSEVLVRDMASLPSETEFTRWSIGFSVASDFTSVGLDEEKSFAMRGGGHLFYALSPRFTLGTGVVFSDKKYATNVDYYAPPEGYWAARTNGVIPDKIDGSCKVVDVPLNLSFAALSQNKFRITTTAGISSYLLLDEIYSFTFNQNNPGAASGWQTDENTFAPFSIINLAAGIVIFPKNKIHTGIDVFYKLPVKQVGWGNVELHSMGVQVFLMYNL